MTVLENVVTGALLRYTSVAHAQEKAEEILVFTGLIGKKDFRGTELTIADKKRLEVSMAPATQPKLLMLDEAMAGLTIVELRQIIDLIKKIREQGMTLVVVETRYGSRYGDIGSGCRPQFREKNHGGASERSRFLSGSHPSLSGG